MVSNGTPGTEIGDLRAWALGRSMSCGGAKYAKVLSSATHWGPTEAAVAGPASQPRPGGVLAFLGLKHTHTPGLGPPCACGRGLIYADLEVHGLV